MSFLSAIVSDIKSVATDPGKIAKDICDAVLPQNMKAVGDIVGGAIDLETGNPLQALSHMADALKDLPQMAQGLPGTTGGKTAATPAGTAAAEPTPPPARAPSLQPVISELTALAGGGGTASANPSATASTPTATATSAAPASTAAATTPRATATPATTATQTAAPATSAPADPSVSVSYRAPVSARVATPIAAGSPQLSASLNVGGTAVTVTESVATTMVATRNPATGATAWQRVPTTPTFTVTTGPATTTSSPSAPTAGSAAAAATPAPAAAGTAAAASAPAPASSTGTTTTTTAAAPATGAASSTGTAAAGSATGVASSTGTAAAGSAATPSSLSSLMSMSNDQFMQAVTSGNIPADVANDPSAMAEIQARMNQITQMNQLVTSMMAAMHQMQMAIIQNIRV